MTININSIMSWDEDIGFYPDNRILINYNGEYFRIQNFNLFSFLELAYKRFLLLHFFILYIKSIDLIEIAELLDAIEFKIIKRA